MRHTNPSKLYDVAEQGRAQQVIFHRSDILPILHPPFEAVFFSPLTAVPYLVAYVVWGLLNIFLWLSFVRIVRTFVPIPEQPFRFLLLCFCFFPVWVAFLHGGTSLMLLVSYSLVYSQLRQGRDFSAGAMLGLGLFRFQFVLPFAAICLLRRKWRFLAGFAAVACVLGLISLSAVGTTGLIAYLQALTGNLTNPADRVNAIVPPSLMVTLRAFLLVLLQNRIPITWINIVLMLTSAGLIAFLGERWRGDDRNGGKHMQ